MTEWLIWPIFITQFIAFTLLLLPNKKLAHRLCLKHISFLLLFLICLVIVISLYHDSTDKLPLFF